MSCKTVERSAQTRDVPRATVADARIPRVAVQHSSGCEDSADSVDIAPADERIPCKTVERSARMRKIPRMTVAETSAPIRLSDGRSQVSVPRTPSASIGWDE